MIRDLRYCARMLMKNRGFTLAAVLCLGLGIGVNTAIFSIIDALLFRPLPVPQADQLVALRRDDKVGLLSYLITYRIFSEIRENNEFLSGLAAYQYERISFGNRDRSEVIKGELVSSNYFDVLRLKPALGRTFLPEEDRIPGAHLAAVVSHNFWRSRLSGDPNVIGRTITLNGQRFTIIGIAPAGFKGIVAPFGCDIWIPLSKTSGLICTIGRLKPGVSLEQAQAALQIFSPRPDNDQSLDPHENGSLKLVRTDGVIFPYMRRLVTKAATLLGVIVGIVLMIACSNLANLLLARASVRRKEIAVRMALGASRLRLIRLLMTESVLLALIGASIGLLVASLFNRLLIALVPPLMRYDVDLRLDAPVLGFTLLLSLVTSALFGLAPALQASKPDLIPALKDENGKGVLHTRKINLRSALVIAQVAISLPLLICAGLFIRSLQKDLAIDLGFKPENRLVLVLSLEREGYNETTGRKFVRRLMERVVAIPGVRSASVASNIPMGFSGDEGCGPPDGGIRSVGIPVFDCNEQVSPQFFQTMGIPIVRGREFSAQDSERGNNVVIINESLARHYWPGEDPLGKQLRVYGLCGECDDKGESFIPPREIIGIVKDTVAGSVREEPRPLLYIPFQNSLWFHLIVHTSNDTNGVIKGLRREISSLNENLPVENLMTMTELVSSRLWIQRLGASLLGIFGLLGLLLTAVGIYGVTAYNVAQQTREIGVRMALGAQAGDILRLIMKQVIKLMVIGTTIGLALAFAGTRLLTSFLYGVRVTDPISFAGLSVFMIGVTMIACYLPARRATKVDPMVSLRHE
jgi:macrolide transport system ATP-binding/permease protein